MKNAIIGILATLVVVLGCTLGYVLLNKDDSANSNKTNNDKTIEENKNEVVEDNKKEENEVGSVGIVSTHIKSNYGEGVSVSDYSIVDITINSDGTLSGSLEKYCEACEKHNLTFKGISERAISIIKTSTCAPEIFKIAVLTESGDVYVADTDKLMTEYTIEFEKKYNDATGIDLEKINSTCNYNSIIVYGKDKNKNNIE